MKTLLANRVHKNILGLNPWTKWIVIGITDTAIFTFALWAAFALRFASWWPDTELDRFASLFLVTPLIGILAFVYLDLYRIVIRFMGVKALISLAEGVILVAIILLAISYFFGLTGFPRSIPVNFALVAFVLCSASRLSFRGYHHWVVRHYVDKEPVLIYGAGVAGSMLAASILNGNTYYPLAFIDDNPALWGRIVQGIKIYPPADGHKLVREHQITRLFLAVPSATRKDRKRILDSFEGEPVHVQTVPSLHEIFAGVARLDQLREIDLEDLLGRDPIPPRPDLMAASVACRVVLVTGAGGSIGSEICRQAAMIGPKALVLYELSEFALYSIEQELIRFNLEHGASFPIYAILGNICDQPRVERMIKLFGVQTIYHAAAYKHVPMVELNVFEGVRNNVIGTQVVAEAALRLSVERFILISTDKAVRPTNVMGATKRFAELLLQDLASRSADTIFAMVRFGNVLGSSGSVVPLFRQQIGDGGPVTVTHKEITRFFMTTQEAAGLVIQAGSLAKGGDLFVLDMGEPVRIEHLARRMIELSGLEVKEAENPEGDIEIVFTGLRPGEKLYEELLIGENVAPTSHPKILRAQEERIPRAELERALERLVAAERDNDTGMARSILREVVAGFRPSSEDADMLRTD